MSILGVGCNLTKVIASNLSPVSYLAYKVDIQKYISDIHILIC